MGVKAKKIPLVLCALGGARVVAGLAMVYTPIALVAAGLALLAAGVAIDWDPAEAGPE